MESHINNKYLVNLLTCLHQTRPYTSQTILFAPNSKIIKPNLATYETNYTTFIRNCKNITYFLPIFFTANPKFWKILPHAKILLPLVSPNTQTVKEARTHKLLSYIYVDQVTNVPCSFFPQSAVDDNGYVPLVDAKDRLHHKHDPKTPPRMCLRLRGGHREVLNSTQNSGRSQLYWYIQAQFFMGFWQNTTKTQFFW